MKGSDDEPVKGAVNQPVSDDPKESTAPEQGAVNQPVDDEEP